MGRGKKAAKARAQVSRKAVKEALNIGGPVKKEVVCRNDYYNEDGLTWWTRSCSRRARLMFLEDKVNFLQEQVNTMSAEIYKK